MVITDFRQSFIAREAFLFHCHLSAQFNSALSVSNSAEMLAKTGVRLFMCARENSVSARELSDELMSRSLTCGVIHS